MSSTETVPDDVYERDPAASNGSSPPNGAAPVAHAADLELDIATITLIYPERRDDLIAAGLTPDLLYRPALRDLVAIVLDQHRAGATVDHHTIRALLPAHFDQRILQDVAGRPIGTTARITEWVTELRRLHHERTIDHVLARAQQARADRLPAEHIQDILAELEHRTSPSTSAGDLHIESIADVAARVDAADPPRYLARPVWPEDAYGVIAAEDKAGKSWAALDLGVAVAAGTSWLDHYPCEITGPVLMFLGEGSDRKTIRRLRAVAEFHGATLEDLDIRVCHRAPNLTNAQHLARIRADLAQYPARLVILDPAYLSLGKTNSGLLGEMGLVLGALQYEAQTVGAALVVVHHWNQTGTGTGRNRMSGAGYAEWGRILVSVAVTHRGSTDGIDTLVSQSWEFVGDEIPDSTLKIDRRVWTDDPESLTSPMHYCVMRPLGPDVVADEVDQQADDALAAAVLEILSDGRELSQSKLIAECRAAGHHGRPERFRRVFLATAHDPDTPLRLRTSGKNNDRFHYRTDPEIGNRS